MHSTFIVYTKNLDPWRNLAVEEYLLQTLQQGQSALYLWQNQNTVVIGKHQNPWRECQTKLLEQEEGKLARRLSGGGAVFHDIGNLNFTFLVNRESYDLQKQLQVILSAVKKIGISAEFSGRNDIVVNGRKFSGNAFCFRPSNAFHHGTIMIHADIDKLTRYLQVSQEKIRSKGVESIQSRVVNLRDLKPELTIERMIEAMVDSFREIYGGSGTMSFGEEGMEQTVLDQLHEKYSSWQWRYGESPTFDIELDTRFNWGGIQLGLCLQNGRVTDARVYSDAMDATFIESIPAVLQDQLFDSVALSERLRQMEVDGQRREMAEDIARWLADKKL